MDETTYWLALPGEEPTGPFTVDELRRRAAAQPHPEWLVCTDGAESWRPLSEVVGTPPISPDTPDRNETAPPSMPGETADHSYLMILHLSQLAGFLVPVAGLVAPIVLWLVRKDDPEVDRHGREIANWIIFEFVGIVVSALLTLVCIGYVFLLIFAVLGIACPIIGAVKASSGEFYRYPMFFRVLG